MENSGDEKVCGDAGNGSEDDVDDVDEFPDEYGGMAMISRKFWAECLGIMMLSFGVLRRGVAISS